MPNTLLPPSPGHIETARLLRLAGLRLMDSADAYEAGDGQEGEKIALEAARHVRELVRPQPSRKTD